MDESAPAMSDSAVETTTATSITSTIESVQSSSDASSTVSASIASAAASLLPSIVTTTTLSIQASPSTTATATTTLVTETMSTSTYSYMWTIAYHILVLPWHIYELLSYTTTLTLHFSTLFLVTLVLIMVAYGIIRYRILTRYSRLPRTAAKHAGAPFDLHPDAARENADRPVSYPDEFMNAFLSSIKVFGYLDRPVFHELARHLQTKKLSAGEILFRPGEPSRDFYIVVQGCVQVFVEGNTADADERVTLDSDASDDGMDYEALHLEGHHLLHQVKPGGTVSSLFSILSILTEELAMGSDGSIPTTEGTPPVVPPAQDAHPRDNIENEFPQLPGASSIPWQNVRKTESVFPNLQSNPTTPLPIRTDDLRSPEQGDTSTGASRKRHRFMLPNLLARAGSNTTLAVIPAEAFSKLTEKFPNAAAHMVQVILTRFQRVTFLTLYRYLGLTKELLKIERLVNEFAGFGEAGPLYKPELLERLRRCRTTSTSTFSRGVPSQRASDAGLPNTSGLRYRATRRAPTSDPDDVPYEGDFEDTDASHSRQKAPTSAVSDGSSRPPLPTPQTSTSSETNSDDVNAQLRHDVFDAICNLIGLQTVPLSASRGQPPSRPSFVVNSGSRAPSVSGQSDGETPYSPPVNLGSNPHLETASIASVASSNPSGMRDLPPILNNEVDIKFYRRGDILVDEGQKSPGLFFVIDGVLEASMRVRGQGYARSSPEPETPLSVPPTTTGSQKPSPWRKAPDHISDVESLDSYSMRDSRTKPVIKGSKPLRKSLFVVRPGGLAGYLATITGHASFVRLRAKTDVYVGYLPKAELDKYTEAYPSILLTLARRLITQLSPVVLHIDFALEWGQVNAGHVLCRQGAASDCLYIVLNGRLRAISERGSANPRDPSSFQIMGEYGQGESVGELEVLTDTLRPNTVHAIRDTEIAIMPKTLFTALAIRHPEITIQISRIIAARSAASANGAGFIDPSMPLSFPRYGNPTLSAWSKSNVNLKTVAILPITAIVPVAEFAERLRDALALCDASVSLLNTAAVMRALGKHVFTRLGRLKLASWLADQEERWRMVLYVADGGVNSPWTQRCVRQADCILLVALGDEEPTIGEYERLLIGMKTTARKELVLLHSERHCIPGSTAQWLKNRLWVHAHHHVQMPLSTSKMLSSTSRKTTLTNLRHHFQRYYHSALAPHLLYEGPNTRASPNIYTGHRSDFARLARRLLSKSVGLVLGGGGARGISHVGVLKALEDAGIPIDMVGGTSIGAFAGGLYAKNNDSVSVYGKMKAFASRMSATWRKILDLTYPTTALFTGHEFNRGIWKCFFDTQIEDCWLSYFCVTTNITWSRMEIHQTGYMWRYIRASMSLSGYLPPLCDNGNMLLDGGYLNNLPADIMKSMEGADTVIAIDVGCADSTAPTQYADSLSGWWVIMMRFLQPLWSVRYWFSSPPTMMFPVDAVQRSSVVSPSLATPTATEDTPYMAPQVINPIPPTLAEIQSRLAYVSSVKQLSDAKQMEGCLYLHPPIEPFGVLDFHRFQEIFDTGYAYGQRVIEGWRKDGTLEERFGIPRDFGTRVRRKQSVRTLRRDEPVPMTPEGTLRPVRESPRETHDTEEVSDTEPDEDSPGRSRRASV